jgi:hypothetical protein
MILISFLFILSRLAEASVSLFIIYNQLIIKTSYTGDDSWIFPSDIAQKNSDKTKKK